MIYKRIRKWSSYPAVNELWCNGLWLDAEMHPGMASDRGGFLGLGLFETLGGVDGRSVFSRRHLTRLEKSCERLGWSLDLPDFEETVEELLCRNSLREGAARIRLIVTGGSGPHNDLAQGADHLVWISASRAAAPPKETSLITSPWPRNERSPLAGLKTACYAENIIALDYARKQGGTEALFLNTAGDLCESATANVFLVKDGVLLTPPLESGCLPGVGRDVVLEIAREKGMPCDERNLSPDDAVSADEIFLTSSSRGVMPVTMLDGRAWQIGPVTKRFSECYAKKAAEERV